MHGRVLISGLAATLALTPVVTSQIPQQTQPSFRSRLDLVHLDVSVLDRERRPVRGLTAADDEAREASLREFPLRCWLRRGRTAADDAAESPAAVVSASAGSSSLSSALQSGSAV